MPPLRCSRETLLVVEDDEGMRRIVERVLVSEGYRCTAVASAKEARAAADDTAFDLMICDINLGSESGLDLVEEMLAADPHLAAIMMSGLREIEVAERALLAGASGYVLKPFTINELLIAILAALRHSHARLEAVDQLQSATQDTVQRLCVAVELRDPGTALHINEMSELCRRTAAQLGWEPERCELLRTASTMHDVGKIAVADSILLKPGPLTPEERAAMQMHAEVGHRILAGSRIELLQMAATIAWTHHERFDGQGYPRRLAGEEIPLEGRVAAVADVYDALSRDRVYRPRLPHDEVLGILHEGRGTHFDPVVLDAFLELPA